MDKNPTIVTQEYAEENPWEEVRQTPEGRAIGERIVVPTQDDIERYKEGKTFRMCGFCRNFNHKVGQHEFRTDQRAFEVAFRELEHQPDWYGSLDFMGGCNAFDGHAVHAMAPAKIPCQFIEGEDTPYHERDRAVDCPEWKPRNKFGGAATFSRTHRKQ